MLNHVADGKFVLDGIFCSWSSCCICRPFPSSLVPLFQSESKCKTILMKMTLICMKMKLHAELIFISLKGLVLRLVLKKRHKRTWKWPIIAKTLLIVNSLLNEINYKRV